MDRRNFIQKLFHHYLLAPSLFSLVSSISCGTPPAARQKNWIWIPTDLAADDDEWKRRFANIRAAHIDAVLLEVYKGKVAYFGSSRLPVEAEYLERLLPMAKAAGLEVHLWMWSMPCNIDDIIKKHPDWYVVNALGESSAEKPAYVPYYRFMCPSNEEVREFVRGTVSELASYPADGVHFDYIRYPDVILPQGLWEKYGIVQDREYPQYDYCYCPLCREKFKLAHGIDPLEIAEPSLHQAWLNFRYNEVTELVNDYLIPAARVNGKQVTAAVFPNWENVRQQWSKWNLDAVLPMLYNRFYLAGPEWVAEKTRSGMASLKPGIQYYSGLFIDTPDKLKQYILSARKAGANGVSIFSVHGLNDDHWRMLRLTLK